MFTYLNIKTSIDRILIFLKNLPTDVSLRLVCFLCLGNKVQVYTEDYLLTIGCSNSSTPENKFNP